MIAYLLEALGGALAIAFIAYYTWHEDKLIAVSYTHLIRVRIPGRCLDFGMPENQLHITNINS